MYIEMGEKLLDGMRPYVDYEEINFPMIHALNMLPAGLGRLLNIAPVWTFQACIIGLLIICIVLLRRTITDPLTYAVIAFVLVGASWFLFLTLYWGQREHIFTLLYLPFLALRVFRREGGHIGWGLALFIGVMAGLGAAIKPYFALTAVLVEIAGLWVSRRWFIRVPEIAGVALVAGAHISYFAFNPDVLAAFVELIERLQQGYGAYGSTPFSAQFNMLIFGGVSLLAAVGYVYIQPTRLGLMIALGTMTFGSLVGFLLQGKGWSYHAIPFMLVGGIILVLLIATILSRLPLIILYAARYKTLLMLSGAILCIGSFLISIPFIAQNANTRYQFTFKPYIEDYTTFGSATMIISMTTDDIYPLLMSTGRRSASRYAMAHPLEIAYYRHETNDVPIYAQTYLDSLVEDIGYFQPSLIIISSHPCVACPPTLNTLYEHMVAQGIIIEVIDPDYDLLTLDNGFHIYVRKGVVPNQ